MDELKKQILEYLNITESKLDDYLKEATFADLEDYHDFIDLDKASERILKAVKNNEKVMIYGDYDCDGISATSIMVLMFQKLGMKVGFYIPSRYIDGYGITLLRAEQIVQKNYDLVITVDNGVTAYEPLAYLKEHGVDVILTDHHAFTFPLPEAYCVVHPFLKKSNLNLAECGAYVAFMISRSVLGYDDEYLLALAVMATISDMMPLISYNRNLLKLGFKIIARHNEYPINRLFNENTSHVYEGLFNFSVCPKVNAVGRVKEDMSTNDLVRYFVSNDPSLINRLRVSIEDTNNLRKSLVNDLLKTIDTKKYQNDKVIIDTLNTKEGLVGLVANRLFIDLKKPTFIFMYSPSEKVYKGSARSFDSFALTEVFAKLKDYLLTSGGHAKAGGLTIEEGKFADFKKALYNLASNYEILAPQEKYLLCQKEDLTYDIFKFINELGPYGQDFEKVNFALKLSRDDVYLIGVNKNHIKGRLNKDCSLIGWNKAKDIKDEFYALGTLEYDENNASYVLFNVSKVVEKL